MATAEAGATGETTGRAAAMLRYAPNAEVPLHEHDGYEHIFVLEGAQEDGAEGAVAQGRHGRARPERPVPVHHGSSHVPSAFCVSSK